jgi:nickel/cobalt transporter (NicO) family protein
MGQIFIGSLILSLIHAAIPNHWMPLITIARAEKWTLRGTLAATLVTGFAHTLSTVLIGILIGLLGVKLSESYSLIMSFIAPFILISLGVIYVILDIKAQSHHHHVDFEELKNKNYTRSKVAIILSLSVAMFLTPCVEIEAYFFQAGRLGWEGILTVSAVYTLTTVLLMLILVFLGFRGIQRLRSHTLEHHEKIITGSVLIVLGILAFFVN